MSSLFNSSINVQLPAYSTDALDAKTALAIYPLYTGISSLHRAVSFATGDWIPYASEYAGITPANSLLSAKHKKFYAKAGVAITAGQLVYITNVAGVAVMQLANAAVAASIAVGFCNKNVALNAIGEFTLFEGLLAVGGALPGVLYYSQNAAGAIGAAPGTVVQKVGIGVGTGLIYFRISL